MSRGWPDLSLVGRRTDCLAIGEVNQQALFTRVAAVVHHGGAGTTTAAALAGAPQVVIPQVYDQHYWAQRVEQLGIGFHTQRARPPLTRSRPRSPPPSDPASPHGRELSRGGSPTAPTSRPGA